MEKLNLSSNQNQSTISTSTNNSCTCYGCGECLLCIAFLPLVGLSLGIAIAGGVIGECGTNAR